VPWVTPADLSGYTEKLIERGARNISKRGLATSGARLMPKGSVLFSSRAPIGYVAVAANPISTNQGFKSFVLPSGISPDYVYYYLKAAKDLAVALASGTTFLEISGAKAKQVPLPLAPEGEQSRIVAEIEKQFTRLDAAVVALKRVQANLKRYRAAVLKAACEGRLVPTEAELARKEGRSYETGEQLLARILKERRAKWEADQLAKMHRQKKYREPERPDVTDVAGLPEGWVRASLDQLSSKIADGEHLSPKTTDSGVYLLSAKDVRDHGVTFEDPKYVSEDDALRFRQRCDPELGDLLIVSRGATIGRVSRVLSNALFCLMGSVIQVRPVRNVEGRFLSSTLKSSRVQKNLTQLSGSTAQQAIYLRDIRSLPIPLPPVCEQIRISNQIECQTSELDDIARDCDLQLRRAERLRQSILKRAFEGKLVPQDPNDEPASVLLERIRAERTTVSRSSIKSPRRSATVEV
jgi:type I restriction enzyme S subunit